MNHQIATITMIFLRAKAHYEGVNALVAHSLITDDEATARRDLITIDMDIELGLRRPV